MRALQPASEFPKGFRLAARPDLATVGFGASLISRRQRSGTALGLAACLFVMSLSAWAQTPTGATVAPAPSGGDDSAVIQGLLDALHAHGGGTLELESGTYHLAKALVSPGGDVGYSLIRLIGQGAATVLQPAGALPALIRVTAGHFEIRDIRFQEVFDTTGKAEADAAVLIDKPTNNLPMDIEHATFIKFPKAVQALRGDDWQVRESFFNGNGTNLSLECRGDHILNVIIEGNSMLGGNGIDLPASPTPPKHVEGLQILHNTILPAFTGSFCIRIQAGLEIYITNNILDQNKAAGVILDGSQASIIYVKLVENWIGSNGPNSTNGLWIIGGPHGSVRDVDVMGGTITGFKNYSIYLDGSASPIVGVLLDGLKLSGVPKTTWKGDLFAENVFALQLRDNIFTHPSNTVTETGKTLTLASGNWFAAKPHHVNRSRYRDNLGDDVTTK